MLRTITFLAVMLVSVFGTCFAGNGIDQFFKATSNPQNEITPLYFGIHFGSAILPGRTTLRSPWPPLNFGTVRLWDTYTRWADVTPRPGEWNFTRIDDYVALAQSHHADVLYVLGSTPGWASARPEESCPYGKGCAADPVRMAHWEEYVRRVAQRYKGKISAYELWNEPFFSDLKNQKGGSDFYYGPVSKMVEMAKLARKILDEFDPTAALATPGFTGPSNQLELFLSSGGKEYIQAIAFHFYSADDLQFINQVLEVRAIMKRQGVEHLPLWNTETGLEVYPTDQPLPSGTQSWTYEEAASRMAQFLVLGAAAGLERFYYYGWENLRSGMITESGQHLPNYEAMEKIQNWLLSSRLTGCVTFDHGAVRCDGEHDGQRFVVAWADKPGEKTLELPKGWRVTKAEPLLGSELITTKIDSKSTVTLHLVKAPVHLVLEPVISPL